jgi:hypothetical protein
MGDFLDNLRKDFQEAGNEVFKGMDEFEKDHPLASHSPSIQNSIPGKILTVTVGVTALTVGKQIGRLFKKR